MSLKMYTFIFSLCMVVGSLSAQPVLTTAGQTPAIGETYEVQYAEVQAFDPGPTGPNQTWDFSDLTLPFFEIQFSILAPEDGLSSADFPDADFVWLLEEFEAHNFYQVTDTGLDLVGGASGVPNDILFKEIFTDSEDGLQLPATYLDDYTYYSAFTSFFFGTSTTNERNGSVEFDGYGTIILPDGTTYENVLRMKIVAQTTAFPIQETQYAWILPGQFVPVMVYSFEDDDESVPSIYYSKRNVDTSVERVSVTDFGLRLLQNPVQDVLRLQATVESPQTYDWYIVDVLGGVRATAINDSSIEVNQLLAGTYYLVAQKDGQRQILPFVKI
ncbi:MAG: T9SS type A sorting domain-containing protein [Bacteroidota bacterium]